MPRPEVIISNSTTPSLFNQATWLFSAKIVGFIFSFALPIVIVRVLPIAEFGRYRQVFVIVTTLATTLPFGVGISSFYYLARKVEQRPAAIFNIVLFLLFAGGVAFSALAFFPNLLATVFGDAEIEELSALIGLLTWVWIFSLFLDNVAVANREARLGAMFFVGSQFSRTILVLFAATTVGTVRSIIVASIVQAALQSVVLLAYLIRRFPGFWKSFELKFFREHLSYALPFGFIGLLWHVQTDLHYFFVGYNFGPTEFAIYAVGCFQLPLIGMLSESVNSVMIPRMSELQLSDNRVEMIRLVAKATRKLAVVYFPVFIFFFITAETLITLLFTEQYKGSATIFRIFILMLPTGALISDAIVRAYKELGQLLLKFRILSAIVLIGALFLAAKTNSLLAIVTATVGVRLAETILAEIAIFRRIGFKRADFGLFKGIWKIGFCSLIAGLLTIPFYLLSSEYIPLMTNAVVSRSDTTALISLSKPVSNAAIMAFSFLVFTSSYLFFLMKTGGLEDDERRLIDRLWFIRNKESI